MAVKASATITLVRVNDGAAGVGITKTEVFYYLSTSNTTQTGGSWSTTVPTWVDGRYYWQKIKVTYTSGSSTESTPVCITGGKGSTGSTGSTGATGTGVSSIAIEFYLSTSKTTQSGGSWTTTMPTWSSGKYLWTRNKIVYKNPTSTVYTTPICDSSWEAVNEVEVGGRNFLKKTDYLSLDGVKNRGTYHEISIDSEETHNGRSSLKIVCNTISVFGSQDVWQFLYKSFEHNKEMTLSFYVKGSVAGSMWARVGGGDTGGNSSSSIPISTEWKKVSLSFPIGLQYNSTSTSEVIYGFRQIGTYWINSMKMELGNKATDWTPAPEDVDGSINDTKNELEDSINKVDENAMSLIEQLKNQISMLVVGENGESLMEQTEDGWAFSMSEIIQQINSVVSNVDSMGDSISSLDGNISSVANGLAELTSYVRIGSDNGVPYIELGADDSLFKVRITNTEINFYEGSNIPAYISNNALHIDKAEIDDSINFGGFSLSRRPNGNFGISWEGE